MKNNVKGIIVIIIIVLIITFLCSFYTTGNIVNVGWWNKQKVYTTSEVDKLIEEGDTLITLKLTKNSKSVATQDKQVIESLDDSKSEPSQSKINQVSKTATLKNEHTARGSIAYTSPGTHKYARELGVDIEDVQGTGEITELFKMILSNTCVKG